MGEPIDRGDGWSPGYVLRPTLRRRCLEERPAEDSWKEWAREPRARAQRGAKAHHNLGTVSWADL